MVLSRASDKRDFKRRVICPSVFSSKISKRKKLQGKGSEKMDGRDLPNPEQDRAMIHLGQLGHRTVDSTFDISARLMIRSAAARLSSSVQSDAIIRNLSAILEKLVLRHWARRGPAF